MNARAAQLLSLAMISAASCLSQVATPELPDSDLVRAYERAAVQNVLAAVNPKVFFGYFSVCADGKGFGYGNTYPSLDGHEISDALLWLGQLETVKANWDYVRSFQREDGLLPLAILPSEAGKRVGPEGFQTTVAPNGGLYVHWVPGNPLEALASPTYIQNADVIFRQTLDRVWLSTQLSSINRAADYLDSLTTAEGAVRGGGYYVERPARIASDGVTQCYAVDALHRVAALNRVLGERAPAEHYERLAERIRHHFVTRFWLGDHFAEYDHPGRGLVGSHGLTDVDWAAIAMGLATPEQQAILWPRLKDEKGFYYNGIPTGIVTRPETYEDWEFTYPDRHDLAAMGRVWYLEAWARARMGDAEGLLSSLRAVSAIGRAHGYYWHERYPKDAPADTVAFGPNEYLEYPSNLIRIVQRFLLGVEFRLDSSLVLTPTVPDDFYKHGFGETLTWRGCRLHYKMLNDRVEATFSTRTPQRLGMRLPPALRADSLRVTVNGSPIEYRENEDLLFLALPSTQDADSSRLEISSAHH